MKFTKFFVFVLAAICFAAPAMAAKQVQLAVVTKPGSAQYVAAEKFAELINKRSNGEYNVKLYHSGSLGKETEILQQVQLGAIQMAIVTLGPFDTFVPEIKAVAFPFLFKDSETADRVLDGPVGKKALDSLAQAGFKGLQFSENGFRNLSNNRGAIHSAKDVKGLKLRVMQSTFHKELWRTLDANPTPMGWPIYSELQQGTIDGQENPLWVFDEYKLYEVQKYLALTGHVYSVHIDIANLQWFEALPKDTQTMFETAMRDAAIYQRKVNREREAEYLATLKEKGMIIDEHPDMKSFREMVKPMKNMDMYKEPKTRALLDKLLDATK